MSHVSAQQERMRWFQLGGLCPKFSLSSTRVCDKSQSALLTTFCYMSPSSDLISIKKKSYDGEIPFNVIFPPQPPFENQFFFPSPSPPVLEFAHLIAINRHLRALCTLFFS